LHESHDTMPSLGGALKPGPGIKIEVAPAQLQSLQTCTRDGQPVKRRARAPRGTGAATRRPPPGARPAPSPAASAPRRARWAAPCRWRRTACRQAQLQGQRYRVYNHYPVLCTEEVTCDCPPSHSAKPSASVHPQQQPSSSTSPEHDRGREAEARVSLESPPARIPCKRRPRRRARRRALRAVSGWRALHAGQGPSFSTTAGMRTRRARGRLAGLG